APPPTEVSTLSLHDALPIFKGMVRLLHAAGLEVLLDVVHNHTCEGGTDGLQLSWRGLDPTVYYLHDGGSPARFADVTGCGNTLRSEEHTSELQSRENLVCRL